jgi:hypothetical protein
MGVLATSALVPLAKWGMVRPAIFRENAAARLPIEAV